ncbi:hypothetical protein DL766_005637 [Monosporascus sp. MC13-8B]|uniref:Uncharacterized protein n=1 Tax=Monosporascus cannonballus TaxID=155416 RepID=A0ABY0GTX0_9PEZI|nr:hypothetical protein DL762_009558 [Monosporascus cannonballus]RYP28935.1 hypothetical protein DL766_005637 [Monosporascus sp. MC13-8B]
MWASGSLSPFVRAGGGGEGLASQFSSGEPPYPTLPSHWFASHVVHPISTASRAEVPGLSRERYASSVAAVKGPPHVFITMGRPGELEAWHFPRTGPQSGRSSRNDGKPILSADMTLTTSTKFEIS